MNEIYCENCLTGLKRVKRQSVDLVFADLPYGRTQNRWDKLISIQQLWAELKRVCQRNAPMIFTAMQPFTSLLVSSNLDMFKYEMIWKKNKPRGHLNAKKQPLRIHENILVFYAKQPKYYPQMSNGHPPVNVFYTRHAGQNYGRDRKLAGGGSTTRYPTSVLEVPVVNNDAGARLHPTQKPEALIEWFIKSYTVPGDLVLNPTAGSGSTLLAAKKLRRQFIGFETDRALVEKVRRLLGCPA